ncbi:MAG: DUF998 domain-containing protein [Nitrososphaerota archaeon]|nr:DUF998 domain-containing protein [Nitrososphaerota archaeon]
MRYDPLKIGGVLYIIAVFQFFIFELVAETLYPGYSVANNYISDLGATCVNPPSTASCIVHQPSATIFDTTLLFLGLLLLVGTHFVYYGTRKKPYFIVTAVADIAILLVGVFPENTGWIHGGISVILFLFIGISLILAWTIVKGGVFRYLTVAFGVLTLYFNFFSVSALGNGGSERLLVLSILCGVLSLGGYLTGQDSSHVPVAKRQNEAPAAQVISVKKKLLLISIVLIAVGLGLMLFSDPVSSPSHLGTSGSLPPGCSKQSNGGVICSSAGSEGNSSLTPHVINGEETNFGATIETIVAVSLIGLGLILVAIGAFSNGAIAYQTKAVT